MSWFNSPGSGSRPPSRLRAFGQAGLRTHLAARAGAMLEVQTFEGGVATC